MVVAGFGPCGPGTVQFCLIPPFLVIDTAGIIVLILIIIGLLRGSGVTELYFPTGQMSSLLKRAKGMLGMGDVIAGAGKVAAVEATTGRVLRTCSSAKWVSHIAIFWGFVLCGISTTLAFLMKPEGAILPLTHPVKIFGNVGGLLLIGGLVAMFLVRFQQSGSPWDINRADIFLILLLLTTVSGVILEAIIYALGRSPLVTATAYWVHLVLVAGLFVTAPYTKFVHAIYKPMWLLYRGLESKVMQRAPAA